MSRPTSESIAAQQTAHAAMVVLGAEAYREVMKLWVEVAAGGGRLSATTIKRFSQMALRVMKLRREQIAQITIAHQRLQRTLRVGDPLEIADVIPTERPRETLQDLRVDFYETVKKYAPQVLASDAQLRKLKTGDLAPIEERVPEGEAPATPAAPTSDTGGRRPGDDARVTELPRVRYAPYSPPPARGDDDTRRLTPLKIAQLEADLVRKKREVEREAELRLAQAAADAILRQREAERKSRTSTTTVRETEGSGGRLNDTSARGVAATAAASVRSLSHATDLITSGNDPKVVGYVRMHYSFTGSKPCAFCAALLSRGVVYKSRESAGGNFGSEFQYHPNCKCRGEAVYEGEDFETDPRFAINRFYKDRWRSVVNDKGLSGSKARKTWRRNIDAFNRGRG